jgi:Protein of unknown function (DUF3015)
MPCTGNMLLRMIGILLVSVSLGACTVTQTVKDFLSSTTPGDWYGRDGLPKAEHKLNVFVAVNMDNLKVDLARGQGEYLDALSVLLAISPERRQEFSRIAQREYPLLAGQDKHVVGASLIALAQPLRTP